MARLPLSIDPAIRLAVHWPDGRQTDIPLSPGGEFQQVVAVDLARPPRGWYPIRYELGRGDRAIGATGQVFVPPPGADLAILVDFRGLVPPDRAAPARAGRPTLERIAAALLPLVQAMHAGRFDRDVNPVGYVTDSDPAVLEPVLHDQGYPGGPVLREVVRPGWLHAVIAAWAGEPGVVLVGTTLPAGLASIRHALAGSRAGVRGLFLRDVQPVTDLGREGRYAVLAKTLRSTPLVVFQDVSEAVERARSLGLVRSRPRASWDDLGPAVLRRARHRPTRYPLVFCHGMLAYSSITLQRFNLSNYFVGLRQYLEDRGYEVLMPELDLTSGIATRAEQLRDTIVRWTSEPVNLIGHSMGGMDARYMISRLEMAGRVASLTTIATPHRGTAMADWFIEHFERKVPIMQVYEALGRNLDGFRDMVRARCREFNQAVPDMPGVRYFSYSAAQARSRVPGELRRAWDVIMSIEGPNDGLVSVISARWGEHLGTVTADHYALTGERGRKVFDHLRFYDDLVRHLARQGF